MVGLHVGCTAVITQFISTNMLIVGFNEFHEFFYEFQAVSTATPSLLVCFGGHFIMQLITPSPFTS